MTEPSFQDEAALESNHPSPEAVEAEPAPSPSPNPVSLRQKWLTAPGLWIGLGIGLLAGLGLGGMRLMSPPATANDADPAAETAAQAVTVAEVGSTTISRTLDATGTVVPYDLLPIAPRTSGLQILQVLVDEGDVVQAGQVLAVLDDAVLRSQLLEAQASLESARAFVRQQQANLAQAQATLNEADTNLRRFQTLRDEGVISEQDYDSRATTAITSQESVQVAIANINSAEAQVLSQEARIQQLQTQLEQTLVIAPVDGIVAERMAKVGDVSSTGDPLFSLIQNGQLELEVPVPETQLPQVRIGAPVTVTSDADARIELRGRVREIAPLIDPQTREAVVTVELPPSALLRSGMFLRAALVSSAGAGLVIPADALLPQPDGRTVVYVVENDQAIAKTIEVGEILPGEPPTVEVRQGLNRGDRVVVSGATYLNEGDRVSVVSTP